MNSNLNRYDYLKPRMRFRFVNENELQKAIDKVRRERIKLKEWEIWSEFCTKELQKLAIDDRHSSNSKNDSAVSEVQFDKKKIYSKDMNTMSSIDSCLKTENTSVNEYQAKDTKKSQAQKESLLSYSNMTSISLPQPDTMMEIQLKIEEMQEKINFTCSKLLNVLEVIESNLNNFREPDTPAEIAQLHQKASEFCIRFSRNHFYQIQTQYNHLKSLKENEIETKHDKFTYNQKVFKLYQTLLLGYYTFYRHMYIVWGFNGIADKLNSLLNITVEILRNISISVGLNEKFLKDLKITIRRISESLRCFIDHKSHSFHLMSRKPTFSQKRIKSAGNSVYTINSAKTNSTTKLFNSNRTSACGRRRVQSAATTMSSGQFSMYQSEQTLKNIYNCRFCHPNAIKNENGDVFKRLTTNLYKNKEFVKQGLRNNNYKKETKDYNKNCHDRIRFNIQNGTRERSKSAKNKNSKFHIVSTNKPTAKVKTCTTEKVVEEHKDFQSLYKNEEMLLERLIPLIADHFKGLQEDLNIKNVKNNIPIDNKQSEVVKMNRTNAKEKKTGENNKRKDELNSLKSKINENHKIVIGDVKDSIEDTRKSPDSPSHYFHDSIVKKEMEEDNKLSNNHEKNRSNISNKINISKKNKKAENAFHNKKQQQQYSDESNSIKAQSQINKISEDLISNELSTITMEIDTPLKQFIKRELKDFSNFMYKIHSIGK